MNKKLLTLITILLLVILSISPAFAKSEKSENPSSVSLGAKYNLLDVSLLPEPTITDDNLKAKRMEKIEKRVNSILQETNNQQQVNDFLLSEGFIIINAESANDVGITSNNNNVNMGDQME